MREVQSLLEDPGLDLPKATVRQFLATKTPTRGTARKWQSAHTYCRCLVWADTQRGTEGTIGGRTEAVKQFKAAVLKDTFVPKAKDRLLVDGQLYEITGSNLGAVDSFCLIFDLVLTEGDK